MATSEGLRACRQIYVEANAVLCESMAYWYTIILAQW